MKRSVQPRNLGLMRVQMVANGLGLVFVQTFDEHAGEPISLTMNQSGTFSDRFVAGVPESEGSTPWLGVRFVCAGAYLRVYRNKAGTAYTANCPKCGKCMRFRVGQGGSSQRFFEVSC